MATLDTSSTTERSDSIPIKIIGGITLFYRELTMTRDYQLANGDEHTCTLLSHLDYQLPNGTEVWIDDIPYHVVNDHVDRVSDLPGFKQPIKLTLPTGTRIELYDRQIMDLSIPMNVDFLELTIDLPAGTKLQAYQRPFRIILGRQCQAKLYSINEQERKLLKLAKTTRYEVTEHVSMMMAHQKLMFAPRK